MKTKPAWIVAVMVAAATLGPQLLVAGEAHTEHFEQSYEMAADGVVSLDNVNGDVTVEVWDQPQLWLRAERSASSPELLEALKIEVEADGRDVRIDTRYPNQMRRTFGDDAQCKVTYTLTVPRSATVDSIDLVNGDLRLSGVDGAVRADTVNGSIELAEVHGDLELETVNGTIEAHCGSLDAGRRLSMESVNGEVRVHLSPAASAEIDVETVNGHIDNDFGLEVRRGKYVGADLRGTLGGGGAELRVETVNGGVRLLAE